MDASRVAGGRRADPAHRNSAALWAAVAFVSLTLTLSAAPAAYATDIYARAIGQEYLPEAPPPAPARKDDGALPDLPALGSERSEPQARGETGFWYRLLIGTVLVAAIAALGDGDGGGTPAVTVGTGAPTPNPDTPGPGNSGNNGNNAGSGNGGGAGAGNGGGPGIGIEVGLGNDDRPRGGPRGRDRDDNRGRGRRGGNDD